MGNYTITVTTPDRTMTVAEAEAELKRLLNQEVRILTAETPCPHDYYYFDTDGERRCAKCLASLTTKTDAGWKV